MKTNTLFSSISVHFQRFWFRGILLVISALCLNASLTFENVWPTLGVRLSSLVSVELLIVVVVLLAVYWKRSGFSRSTQHWLGLLWVFLVLGRYVDVTVPSLYGRDLNLYWDARHLPAISAMLATVAESWLVALTIGTVIIVPLLIYLAARLMFLCVIDSLHIAVVRRTVGVTAIAGIILATAQMFNVHVSLAPRFAAPVTHAYFQQATSFAYEMTGSGVRALPPPAPVSSKLDRVNGADVFIIFVESYGAVSWDQQVFVEPLSESRKRLENDIDTTGRAVASAFVESTTFGGESWLAHISLLSGTEVRDQKTNMRLMAQSRDTMVTTFSRHGYRTMAIMPGLQREWPDGNFYGFDEIYGSKQLGYQGPPFGWWDITDQFAIARMDALVYGQQPHQPAFVFFPTISTHTPFIPTPPYQSDWKRILTAKPYDTVDLDRAWAQWADWLNLGPGYVQALEYLYQSLGGYLQLRSDRDFVIVLIGDHQPPALVSGSDVSWDVPVHVIASRRALLDRLELHGFQPGLTPAHPTLGSMHRLLPILLDAFGDRE